MPEKERMSLAGVEYKAIPSGSHHIHEDFVWVIQLFFLVVQIWI